MSDWRSYDNIAERYDLVWSARFEAVARHMSSFVPPGSDDRVLDIGTGTGIVLKVLAERPTRAALMVGCDRSAGMLARARTGAGKRLPPVQMVAAEATALPFAEQSFDLVTASFVLSHVPGYPTALAEISRILKASGRIAVSSWAPPSDPYNAAWDEYLAGIIDPVEARRAVAQVIPWEEHFSQEGALQSALRRAGFAATAAATIDVDCDSTVDEFVEDRQLSSGGRWARHELGEEPWTRVRAALGERLRARFGPCLRYHRRAFIVTARKT
ncbi:MAG TPA: methyltransferase domain-containing protein [Terriglobia bacterium]|nr:methyltransferase domain-containing protein [Terriglobia bacterium]